MGYIVKTAWVYTLFVKTEAWTCEQLKLKILFIDLVEIMTVAVSLTYKIKYTSGWMRMSHKKLMNSIGLNIEPWGTLRNKTISNNKWRKTDKFILLYERTNGIVVGIYKRRVWICLKKLWHHKIEMPNKCYGNGVSWATS